MNKKLKILLRLIYGATCGMKPIRLGT